MYEMQKDAFYIIVHIHNKLLKSYFGEKIFFGYPEQRNKLPHKTKLSPVAQDSTPRCTHDSVTIQLHNIITFDGEAILSYLPEM